MTEEGFTATQLKQIELVAKLAVREFHDSYLTNVWPQQLRDIHRDVEIAVRMHDSDDKAHGSVEAQFLRFKWTLLGLAMGGGAAGGGLLQLLLKAL